MFEGSEALDEVVNESVASSICADADAGTDITCNAKWEPAEIREYCILPANAQSLIRSASARGYHRVLKVGHTIAGLEDGDVIQTHYLAEALQYRTRVLDL